MHITRDDRVASCFFRSSIEPPYRKALLQVTERCNLHCVHCFLSATNHGEQIAIQAIGEIIIPRLKQCRVTRVTITGGEPFVHPDIIEIARLLTEADIRVGICTNGTLINYHQMEILAALGNVHVNVSLDGFRPESHNKFRGSPIAFERTTETIKQLGEYGLLQGILITPNNHAQVNEYVQLCKFAEQNRASYVLMNPLSSLGRGVKSKEKIGAPSEALNEIRQATTRFINLTNRFEIAYVRFPNNYAPLSSCEAGNIIYFFVHGEVAICPYLVFAARTPKSKHDPSEFITGNILRDADIAEKLDSYNFHSRYRLGNNSTCQSCHLESICGKGCPAAIISSGQRIEGIDWEVCPAASGAS